MGTRPAPRVVLAVRAATPQGMVRRYAPWIRPCLGGPNTGTAVASSLSRRSAGKGDTMWDWIIAAGGTALFGVVIFFWVHWTDRERELFANGRWHHLE